MEDGLVAGRDPEMFRLTLLLSDISCYHFLLSSK